MPKDCRSCQRKNEMVESLKKSLEVSIANEDESLRKIGILEEELANAEEKLRIVRKVILGDSTVVHDVIARFGEGD